ncbi:MAG: hypothetical protein WCI64_02275 [Chlorobium sp.]
MAEKPGCLGKLIVFSVPSCTGKSTITSMVLDPVPERLKVRESEEAGDQQIALERARMESDSAELFDEVVVNDALDAAVDTVTAIVSKLLLKT